MTPLEKFTIVYIVMVLFTNYRPPGNFSRDVNDLLQILPLIALAIFSYSGKSGLGERRKYHAGGVLASILAIGFSSGAFFSNLTSGLFHLKHASGAAIILCCIAQLLFMRAYIDQRYSNYIHWTIVGLAITLVAHLFHLPIIQDLDLKNIIIFLHSAVLLTNVIICVVRFIQGGGDFGSSGNRNLLFLGLGFILFLGAERSSSAIVSYAAHFLVFMGLH